jgi:outer membrane murein-binding lipoprotein Lpp
MNILPFWNTLGNCVAFLMLLAGTVAILKSGFVKANSEILQANTALSVQNADLYRDLDAAKAQKILQLEAANVSLTSRVATLETEFNALKYDYTQAAELNLRQQTEIKRLTEQNAFLQDQLDRQIHERHDTTS